MRGQHRRRRVLDLGRGHVAGAQAAGLRQFEERLLRSAVDVDRDCAVVALGAGRPCRAGFAGIDALPLTGQYTTYSLT